MGYLKLKHTCVLRSLHGVYFSIPDPASLRSLPLTSLSWSHSHFNDEWLETVGAQGLHLSSLTLKHPNGVSGTGLRALHTLTNLTLWGYEDSRFGDSVLSEICELPLLERLELLYCHVHIGYSTKELPGVSRLRYLSLEGCFHVRSRNPTILLASTPQPVLLHVCKHILLTSQLFHTCPDAR